MSYRSSHGGQPRGDTSPLEPSIAPGTTFGRYKIEREIGRGGMGAVFEASHLDLGKLVAVKAILPGPLANEEVRKRLVREGEAVAKIRHPHVVDIYDVGTVENMPYLVMELLEGEDLGGNLRRRDRPFTAEEVIEIMLPVCSGLQAAHNAGVIHRDLKPANIFLARGPHGDVVPKVLDFGIAKAHNHGADQPITTTGALLGTPSFMSPEQALGDRTLDARSDLYSLAVIMYECATGHRPFQAESLYSVLKRIVQGDFERPKALNPEIPDELERVLLQAMATDPEDRFSSVDQFARFLVPMASPRAQAVWEPRYGSSEEPFPPAPKAAAAFAPAETSFTGEYGLTGLLFKTSRFKMLWAALAVFFFIASLAAYAVFRSPEPTVVVAAAPEEYFELAVQAVPGDTVLQLDQRDPTRGSLFERLPKDGRVHRITARRDGYVPVQLVFVDAAPEETIVLAKVPTPTPETGQPVAETTSEPPQSRKAKPPFSARQKAAAIRAQLRKSRAAKKASTAVAAPKQTPEAVPEEPVVKRGTNDAPILR